MKKNLTNFAVIGDGSWGTTLAVHLAKKGFDVKLWGAFPKQIKRIQQNRYNPQFLPGVRIPKNVYCEERLKKALDGSDVIVLAVPSEYLVSILKKFKNISIKDKIILSVVKGIDIPSSKRMSEIISKSLKAKQLAVLSGPTIATEVAAGIPTTAVIASNDLQTAKRLQAAFNSDTFRIYTNRDVVGTELGGSLKNIIAIACGVCDGLGLGSNTKAAILTRGLSEMARLGKAMGAKPKTFSGLSGLGDLVTTAMSRHSRNRYVGEQLGKGKSLKQILSSMRMVAEGVPTAKAALKLAQKYKIAMPIINEVYNILYRRKKAKHAVTDLLQRKTKAE